MPNPKFLEVAAINRAFERLSKELARFRASCQKHRGPIRGVTYRVLDDGETRFRVTYKKEIRGTLK